MLGNIGPLEIGIVLVIALIVFGPKRLPELGSGLGRGLREFKDGVTGAKTDEDDEAKAIRATPATIAQPAPQAMVTPPSGASIETKVAADKSV